MDTVNSCPIFLIERGKFACGLSTIFASPMNLDSLQVVTSCDCYGPVDVKGLVMCKLRILQRRRKPVRLAGAVIAPPNVALPQWKLTHA